METLFMLIRHSSPGACVASDFVVETMDSVALARSGANKREHYLHNLGKTHERQWRERLQRAFVLC